MILGMRVGDCIANAWRWSRWPGNTARPCYVYSQRTLTDHFEKLDRALAPLDHLICFAMKSNSNLAVLRALARLGGGFDIVSGGELRRAIAAGGDPGHCIFAGVGKTEAEIEFALRQGIYAFNAESEPELAAHQPRGRAPEENRPRRRARQPECGRPHARQNHHRHLREQVRHRLRKGRGRYARAAS